MKNKNESSIIKKALIVSIVSIMALTAFSPAFSITGNVKAETNNLPDLSGLTEKHNWSCDGAPTDADITVSETDSSSHTYVSSTDFNRTFVKIHLEEDNKSNYNDTRFAISLPSSPNVQTISGYFYMPEQTGDEVNEQIKFYTVLGGGAKGGIIFHRTPGRNDDLYMYNGTAGSELMWDIPRIPRNSWVYFIISVSVGSTNFNQFVYLSTENYTLSQNHTMPKGPATLNYFNLFFNSGAYITSLDLYLDDLHWYEEYYTSEEKIPTFNNSNVYFKNFGWQEKTWIWELAWDQKVGGDNDIIKTPYINLMDYTKNFTTTHAISFLNQTDYNKQINETLNHTEFKKIMFGGYSGIISYADVLHAVSWAAAHDNRICGFVWDDYSLRWGQTHYTEKDYVTAKDALQKYAQVPVYGMVYTTDYQNLNSTGWNLLDGAFLSVWFGAGYATAIDTLYSVATSHFSGNNLYIIIYTHLYGDHLGFTPEAQHVFFEKYGEWLESEKIAGIVAIGPARFLDYSDDDGDHYQYQTEANEYFAKQMAVSYSSDGRTITISKEEDGKYLNISHLNIPLKYAGNSTITVTSHMNTEVEVEIPSTWDYANVRVRDTTTDEYVNWTQGSVIFDATAGHSYDIYDGSVVVSEVTNNGISIAVWVFITIIMMIVVTHAASKEKKR